MVVDEGGAVVENVFPGVKQPCGLIGLAEKGMINAQFRCMSAGGHASAPKPHTPVGILARACAKVEGNPFKAHIEGPAAQMFDTLGRYSSALYRVIFANMWCFGWIIDLLGKTSGGEMNATFCLQVNLLLPSIILLISVLTSVADTLPVQKK